MQLKCCGIDNSTDWKGKRPKSCCHAIREGVEGPTDLQCTSALPADDILYTSGCFEKIEMKTKDASKVLIGVGIGIAFIEVNLTNLILKIHCITSLHFNLRFIVIST